MHFFGEGEGARGGVLHLYMYINGLYVAVQSQKPLGHLDAELRRALSPETVQGGNRAPSPAATFTLGRFQVLNYTTTLIVSSLNTCVPVKDRKMLVVVCFLIVHLILSLVMQSGLRCVRMGLSVLQKID